MENNGISYNKTISEYDKLFFQAKNIKRRIEDEIEVINNSHKKITDIISAYYKEEHIKLDKKEKDLKLELDLKVTNVKDELEKFLTLSNDILSLCEKIDKTNKYYEKKNINSDIKTLYYISEINKNNLKTKEFLAQPIKNVDISFNSNLNSLEYKDYYLSGIPIPINIKTEEKEKKLFISWNIGDFRIKDFDNKNIKYIIEIKGDNKVEKYEASETNITLEKIKYNIDYEIKIKALIEENCGNWSEIKKFQMKEPHINYGFFGMNNNKNNNNPIFGFN